MGPCKQRELTESIVKDYDISVSRACKLSSLPRTMYYYKSQKDDTEVIEALQDLSFKHPTYGFRKLFAYIRRSGKPWNHKRIYRGYKLLKLNRKRKGKRRLPSRIKQPLVKQELINGTNKPNSYDGISLETCTFLYDSREFTRIIEKTRENDEFLVNQPIKQVLCFFLPDSIVFKLNIFLFYLACVNRNLLPL